MHTPHAVCLFNMVYCSSTIHVPHTVQQNRHHRYRKDLHMFILMCVQQTDRRRRLTDLSFCLKKEKRFTECNEEMLAEWLGHPVLHTHTHLLLLPSSSSQAQFFRWDLFASHKEFTVARRSPSSDVDTS